MPAPKDTLPQYAGSCNPPRRAKRARTDATDTADTLSSEQTTTGRSAPRRARPPILPKDPLPVRDSPAPDGLESDSADEEEYEPSTRASAPRRRGRRAGGMSRSARETQRKLNHSRIEKARRTKINEALATLSALVNAREEAAAKEGWLDPEKGRVKTEEKEFKLDVLVKTVIYMQELIEKVRVLEEGECPKCAREAPSTSAPGLKRKRAADDLAEASLVDPEPEAVEINRDEDVYADDSEKGEVEGPLTSATASPILATSASRPSASPRLPPIASWLPHPYVDPSCIAAFTGPNPSTSPAQLPSPPPSGRFRSSSSAGFVPTLALPAPAHPLGAGAPPSPQSTGRRASVSSRSPTWTPEDETAASLLLQMSSSPGMSASAPRACAVPPAMALPRPADAPFAAAAASAGREGEGVRRMHFPSAQVETPSSLLGLTRR
ncbi:hypothetical protein IEO21_05617 [Rhodonia placenta]|uniref:BHLH domain-containing protein n=1 Tax=Rhodonia placenta TaxID=104341 RepID=A0A8H7P1I4_9APHY|nr:hypothetical protein IEO21_05617 [Postia placenta]